MYERHQRQQQELLDRNDAEDDEDSSFMSPIFLSFTGSMDMTNTMESLGKIADGIVDCK